MDCFTSPTRKQFCFSRVMLPKMASWTALESWYSSTSTSRYRFPISRAAAVGPFRRRPSSRSRVLCSRSPKSRTRRFFLRAPYSFPNRRTRVMSPCWARPICSRSSRRDFEFREKILPCLASPSLQASRTALISSFLGTGSPFLGKTNRPKEIRIRSTASSQVLLSRRCFS